MTMRSGGVPKFASTLLAMAIALAGVLLSLADVAHSAEPASKPAPQRILFLGNSITRHGPKADIGWTVNFGMAASAIEKDYVHVLASALAVSMGAAPDVMIENIADFERQAGAIDLKARLEKDLAFKPHIVVIAIGENVPQLRTEADKAAFGQQFQQLLETFKAKDGPALFVRSCFWPDAAKDQIMKQVSLEAGATFVDISALGKDPANRARAERQIAHDGVAAHPGDKGMKAIADAMFKAITERMSSPKKEAK
jgi:lysophospholipase L1-like esterase